MTEISHDWYRKMMNDSAELINVSLESQYKEMEFSNFISQSQPTPQIQSNYVASQLDPFPFNSLPSQVLPDIPDIPMYFGALLTPEPSRNHSREPSLVTSNRESVQPPEAHKSSRGRKYHNSNLLAHHCQQLLKKTAHPSLTQIDEVVDKLNDLQSSHKTCKKLRSSIREWFRKRREYMATKIYKSFQRLLPEAPDVKDEIDRFIKKVHKNTALLGIIILESHLPMEGEKERIDFVKEKIVDFYLKYPARRRRNLNGCKRTCDESSAMMNLSQDDVNSLLNKQ